MMMTRTAVRLKSSRSSDKLGYCLDGDFCVEFKTDETTPEGYYIYRQVDMSSAATATSAVFSFDYYYKLDDVDAEMKVQYSCNSSGSWTTFPNGTFDDTPEETTDSFSEDIPCTTANTRIRFISTGAKKDKTFSFDNVDISWEIPATPDTETFIQGTPLAGALTLPQNDAVTVMAYVNVTRWFFDVNNRRCR